MFRQAKNMGFQADRVADKRDEKHPQMGDKKRPANLSMPAMNTGAGKNPEESLVNFRAFQ